MQLVVLVETGRAEVYRGDAAPAIDGFAFEPVAGGHLARIAIDGAPEDCDRTLALHLRTLREASREHPTWTFRIEIEPDGGALTLLAGSFGADEDDVADLLAWTVQQPLVFDGAHTKLYVSVRLPEDAHDHFLDLVAEGLSPAETPVTDASPDAIAIGFELSESAHRTAALISALRYAWLAEGSKAQALVELEGPRPIMRRIDDLHGWTELERELRAVKKPEGEAAAPAPWRDTQQTEVARVSPIPAFGGRTLTWLDEGGRMFALGADGIVYEVHERAQVLVADERLFLAIVQRGDGTMYRRDAHGSVELPLEPGSERQIHGALSGGVVITDRHGLDTRVSFATRSGLDRGPVFRNLRALARTADVAAIAIADVTGMPALVTIDPRTWAWDHFQPWPPDATPTDVAALGIGGALVATDLDGGGAQIAIVNTRASEVEGTVYVPATGLQLVDVDHATAWAIGLSPGGRLDLWRIDLSPSLVVTLRTSHLAAAGWGALFAVRERDHWLCAYEAAGLFRLGTRAEALAAVEPGERMTALLAGRPAVAVATSAERSRLLVHGKRVESITLPTIARAPSW